MSTPGRAAPGSPARGGLGDRIAIGVLAVGIAAMVIVALRLSRGFPFSIDEWDMLALYADGGWLQPYNGHLSLIPIAFFQGLGRVVGLGSYLPFELVGLACFCAVPIAWYRTHRASIGVGLAAVGALAIVWSPAAIEGALYAMLVVFTVPALALILAWRLIERDDARGDWGAVAALAVALATSGVGLVAVVAVGVELVGRRASLRRMLRFAPPVLVWFTWWVFYHDPSTPASLGDRARYAWDMVVGILAAFTFEWAPGAIVVAVGLAVLVGYARRWGNIDAHFASVLAAFVFFIAVSAFSRAGLLALNPPDAPRYVWFGGFLVIEFAASCLRNRRIPALVPLAAGAVVLLGAVGLVGNLRDYRTYIVTDGERTLPYLVGAEAAGAAADPNRILPLNLIPVTVSDYLGMVDRLGSPVAGPSAAGVATDALGNPEDRRAADAILIGEEGVTARATPAATDCPAASVATPVDPAEPIRLAPGSSLVIATGTHDATIAIRRLAPAGLATPIATVAANRHVVVEVPRDNSTLPWFVEVDDPAVSATRCGTDPDTRAGR